MNTVYIEHNGAHTCFWRPTVHKSYSTISQTLILFSCSSANLTIRNLITGKDCFYIYLGRFHGQLVHRKQPSNFIVSITNTKSLICKYSKRKKKFNTNQFNNNCPIRLYIAISFFSYFVQHFLRSLFFFFFNIDFFQISTSKIWKSTFQQSAIWPVLITYL